MEALPCSDSSVLVLASSVTEDSPSISDDSSPTDEPSSSSPLRWITSATAPSSLWSTTRRQVRGVGPSRLIFLYSLVLFAQSCAQFFCKIPWGPFGQKALRVVGRTAISPFGFAAALPKAKEELAASGFSGKGSALYGVFFKKLICALFP